MKRAAETQMDSASALADQAAGSTDSIPVEKALAVSLLRAREAVMFHMRPVLRTHGTTEQQWRVLRSLNTTDPIDKTSLAQRSMLLMPSLLRILKDLKAEGLIRLVRSPTNRRLSGVILTARGAEYASKVSADIGAKNIIVRKAIGESTVDDLLALLRKLEFQLLTLRDR